MTISQPPGFLALPRTSNGQGVLVLHAWWGLNDTIKAFCSRLAESGFLAFAPDLYHGQVAQTIEEAEVLSSALDAISCRQRLKLQRQPVFWRKKLAKKETIWRSLASHWVPIMHWISQMPTLSIFVRWSYFMVAVWKTLVVQKRIILVILQGMIRMNRRRMWTSSRQRCSKPVDRLPSIAIQAQVTGSLNRIAPRLLIPKQPAWPGIVRWHS